MNTQTILDVSKHVLDVSKHVLDAPKRVLQEYYPDYRKNSPLPPDLLELCIELFYESKITTYVNGKTRLHLTSIKSGGGTRETS